MHPNAPTIHRGKTAIARGGVSRPLRLALEAGVLAKTHRFFDYGCGRGEDVKVLSREGFKASGWDPNHAPDNQIAETADVVQLCYVLNVIENPAERVTTLRDAWRRAKHALIVAVQSDLARPSMPGHRHGDGYLTTRGTFQKYFSQSDAHALIEETTNAEPASAAPGVFFVFRSPQARLAFIASRRRRTLDGITLHLPRTPRVTRQRRPSKAALRDRDRCAAAQPLCELLLHLGRLPLTEELGPFENQIAKFRSAKTAVRFAIDQLDPEAWESAQDRERGDVLALLAVSRFRGRPKFSDLPDPTQRTIRAYYRNYSHALEESDQLLFSAGDMPALRKAARASAVGKLLPDALYVHTSALPFLPPILRVYEGCASEFLGEVEANIVKLGLGRQTAISYLHYPDFETDPHPSLHTSLHLDLATRAVQQRDYSTSDNPPILHRKETLVAPTHPLRDRFERLTKQEERHNLLLSVGGPFGNRQQWEARLEHTGWNLKGHRLVRR